MKLLLVDFLDSYTHNIPSLLHRASFINATDLQIDIKPYNSLTKEDVEEVIDTYHGVVFSAGPGTVDKEEDIGSFIPAVLARRPAIPVYGICLGFQAICSHFGGTIHRLPSPHHGLISDILSPAGEKLGRKATRYNSLEVRLDEKAQEQLEIRAVAQNHGSTERSIMEIKHRTLPFWGVQYHPESVYSTNCEVTIEPFLVAAQNRSVGKTPVAWQRVSGEFDLLDILPRIKRESSDFVLLDSSSKGEWDILAASDSASLFKYSIREQRMTFQPLKDSTSANGNGHANGDGANGRVPLSRTSSSPEESHIDRSASLPDAWSFLKRHSSRVEYREGPSEVPFLGGFLGYWGYELGLAELGLDAYKPFPNGIPEHGDIQLLWSTETLAYNKKEKALYAISLTHDTQWVENIVQLAKESSKNPLPPAPIAWSQQYKIDHPAGTEYINNIKTCHEEIRSGNSYELCLTATSTTRKIVDYAAGAKSEPTAEPTLIERFRYLRSVTPAEFMSCYQLSGVQMLSASPEEFLTYDAEPGIAAMKPIKGTLPKQHPDGTSIAYEEASKALHQPKVIAENLMIVDLVRHDLAQVSNKVTCPDLMHVDDIGPMYQLISTVEAEVRKDRTAWDLLRKTLPPGSMTGAPKFRSCEILQDLEQGYRGLYSGITGYVDVRGSARTSVNIRNMVKYPGEDGWRIGAGGAITILSDPVDEYNERQLKAGSVARTLVPDFSLLETIQWDAKAGKLQYWDEHMDRLQQTIKHFGFEAPTKPAEGAKTVRKQKAPVAGHLPADGNVIEEFTIGDNKTPVNMSEFLHGWLIERVNGHPQNNEDLRLSLSLDVSGNPSVKIVPMPASKDNAPLPVRLDLCSTSVNAFEPFISRKTSNRAHYDGARERAEVQGRDEVLMFRPAQESTHKNRVTTLPGQPTDLLTEGSYTNVAVWQQDKWLTPSTGCLPGIMREKLLKSGEVVLGDVQRKDVAVGAKLKLFNSVRGVIDAVVVE